MSSTMMRRFDLNRLGQDFIEAEFYTLGSRFDRVRRLLGLMKVELFGNRGGVPIAPPYPLDQFFYMDQSIEQDLKLALQQQQIQVHYQPIVDLRTQQLVGFETLARWYHPNWGWVPPTEFIPLAERTGLIHPLGASVLYQACQQLNYWHQHLQLTTQFMDQTNDQKAQTIDPTPIKLNINLSPDQLSDKNLKFLIPDILSETQCPFDQICFEITESRSLENWEVAQSTLDHFRHLGAEVSLDDFGTGYASLSYLQDLPVTTIKIDRRFIQTDRWDIAEVILDLSERLHLKVIAEGIETIEQLSRLIQLGCPYGQGYYFAKPLPTDQATDWVMASMLKQAG